MPLSLLPWDFNGDGSQLCSSVWNMKLWSCSILSRPLGLWAYWRRSSHYLNVLKYFRSHLDSALSDGEDQKWEQSLTDWSKALCAFKTVGEKCYTSL